LNLSWLLLVSGTDATLRAMIDGILDHLVGNPPFRFMAIG